MNEKIIIVDCGSRYTQLIARKIRHNQVFCEIYPFTRKWELDDSIKGIILSGSPASIKDENRPQINLDTFLGKVPILAIGYGAHYILDSQDATIQKREDKVEQAVEVKYESTYDLFENLKPEACVFTKALETITHLPKGYKITAYGKDKSIMACYSDSLNIHCLNFHPEVKETAQGSEILRQFVLQIAGCRGDWTAAKFVENSVLEIREKVGEDKVIMAISGGVDSSVAAGIINEAIGENLHCIFVNNGLLRKNEYQEVLEIYKNSGINVQGINASKEFYAVLAGVKDPEEKRKAIGKLFIEIFDREAKKIHGAKWLAQGTIYPDIIESVSVGDNSVKVKSHHNVGGLPEKMHLKLLEPLSMLFKDEVRAMGREINLPTSILKRHPFPGPALAIRILGEVTPEKVQILREADDVYISILKETGLYDKIWQAGTILLPIKSVGVSQDKRTYENTIAIRAVNSQDGMTAEWIELPYDILRRISTEIINTVNGVNRVVYDISDKPPSTIEWE